jgi:DNA-binding transcriptional LysR family regulator
LVQRLPTGYRLTEFGEQLLPEAQRLEQAAQGLAQRVAGLRQDATGLLRVTCPETMFYRITHSPLMERFHARYPDIEVEFVTSDAFIDLRQGEADVALRAGTSDDTLVGREIGESPWALFASPKYLERRGRPERIEDLAVHALLWLDESKDDHKTARWIRRVLPSVRLAARSGNMLGLVYSAKTGMGIAPLPVTLGGAEPDLVQVLEPIPELAQTWRILTTPELRRTARVAAFFEFMVEEMETLRSILLWAGGPPEY